MMTSTNPDRALRLAASFRDPSGFLFKQQGQLYRQVNQIYQPHYDHLMASGLYQQLVERGLLVQHQEVAMAAPEPGLAYKVIQPELLAFISYPYEWCFRMLKAAALTTLTIQKMALQKGMTLKDSSAYNIQFQHGRPLLIDSLSFETYREGNPWVAYRQFCQHFLAPLALMAHADVRLNRLLALYVDGLPLELTASLLPGRTRWNLGLNLHIHLHAAAQKRYANRAVKPGAASAKMSRISFLGLIDSLESTVNKLNWKPANTEWGDYYTASASHYTSAALQHKRQVVGQFIEKIAPKLVWDLGANTGEFSRQASQRGIFTLAFDIDPAAVDINYQTIQQKKETHLLPLVMDLTNPSPALGWHHHERSSLLERGPADAVLALALIHHLAISNNVPLDALAAFFHQAGCWLIIEFVPKEDSQVQLLLASRLDIFAHYHQQGFEEAFGRYFKIHESVHLTDTGRILYLMERQTPKS